MVWPAGKRKALDSTGAWKVVLKPLPQELGTGQPGRQATARARSGMKVQAFAARERT